MQQKYLHILNCHVSGACELRQVVMVAPSFFFLFFFLKIESVKIMAWTGAHSEIAVETFLKTGELLHRKLYVLFSCCVRMMLFRVEISTWDGVTIATCRRSLAQRKLKFKMLEQILIHSENLRWRLNSWLRGEFNKFPDFFVQAFKIVIDSWQFSILLLYILWDDWQIFMISGSNEQLQQQ